MPENYMHYSNVYDNPQVLQGNYRKSLCRNPPKWQKLPQFWWGVTTKAIKFL